MFCLYVVSAVPMEDRRGPQVPWDCSFRLLWAAMKVLRIKPALSSQSSLIILLNILIIFTQLLRSIPTFLTTHLVSYFFVAHEVCFVLLMHSSVKSVWGQFLLTDTCLEHELYFIGMSYNCFDLWDAEYCDLALLSV